MLAAGWGRIVNVASTAGITGYAYVAAYCAAKHGVIGMTRALARELGSRGITVNCIAPGFIETDMTKALSEAQTSALMAQIPLGRLGQAASEQFGKGQLALAAAAGANCFGAFVSVGHVVAV